MSNSVSEWSRVVWTVTSNAEMLLLPPHLEERHVALYCTGWDGSFTHGTVGKDFRETKSPFRCFEPWVGILCGIAWCAPGEEAISLLTVGVSVVCEMQFRGKQLTLY